MATLRQQLAYPESGWNRFDADSNVTRTGSGWVYVTDAGMVGGGVYLSTTPGASIQFNFTGSNLRLITAIGKSSILTSSVDVYLDSVKVATYSQIEDTAPCYTALVFQALNLTKEEHSVQLIHTGANGLQFYIDAIDIDSTGAFKPYSPVDNSSVLLRSTMSDSSEREYRISATKANAFVNWYNSHSATDPAGYGIDDSVDGSKEYLAFEKIISFKVIPLAQ